jgi:Flp pilus assembly protein TadG
MAGHMGRTVIANQKGAVLILFALLLLVLLGFTALAMEAGRWYMIRAELSKSVDAAALAGTKNISNPYVDPLVLAQQFGQANFPTGYAGTPAMGTTGAVAFTASQLSDHRIQVTGSVTALAYLAQLFGVNQVTTSASGVAKMNQVEIMLVLDRSGSMGGQPIADLKTAATSFVSFFQDTQSTDKMGLISFNSAVTVNFPLGTNYVSGMTSAIAGMNASGGTNSEDALAQSYGPKGFTDQTGVPGNQQVQQFLLFFTDGQPTAFRGGFTYNGANYDGVAQVLSLNPQLSDCYQVDNMLYDPISGNPGTVPAIPTGDGTSYSHTTKWQVFAQYPVPGYPPNANVPNNPYGPLPTYVCTTGRSLAIDQAQILKNRSVKIYTIGLGTSIDKTFLSQVASGSTFEYYAPTSSDLLSIFNLIAKDIKLRLVQ